MSTQTTARYAHAANGTTTRLSVTVSLAALLTAALAGGALGATPATVLRHDLRRERITVQSLREGRLGYFGADRQYRTDPVGQYLRVRLRHDPEATASVKSGADDLYVLELTDGQRFRGRFVGRFTGPARGNVETGQILCWRNAELGDIDVNLEQVMAIRPHDGAAEHDRPRTDRATLANGDVLAGFVTELTDDGLAMTIPGRPEPVAIAADQLVSLELANHPSPRQRPADMLYLADGSRVFVDAVGVEGDRFSFAPSQWPTRGPFDLPVAWLERLDPAAADVALADVASIPAKVVAGGEVFGLAWPPRVDGSDVLLHAPVTVRYALPAGSERLAALAAIDVGPRESDEWTDFTAVFTVDGREVGRFRITATQPTASVNLPVAGSTLTVRLDPGANGPILDRLRLVEPVVLVRTGGESRTTGP